MLGVGLPGRGHGAVAAAHRGLKVFVLDFCCQVGRKLHLHAAIHKVQCGEPKLKHQVMVELNHVSDGQPDGPEGVFNNILAHLAGMGNWYGVCIDHAETLLVDGSLRLGGIDLLLAVVSEDKLLEILVDDKARFKVVDVGTLCSDSSDVYISTDSAGGDLGQLCVDVKSEGTELADVHALSLSQVGIQVGD